MSEERALVSGLTRQDDPNAIMAKAATKVPEAGRSADIIKFPGADNDIASLREPLTPVSRDPAPADTGIGSVSSRNLANNNPGNMKAEDGSYLKFPTREAGEAAIGSWFDRAQSVHGLKTIEDLIDDPAHRGAHGYSSKYDPGNAGKDLAAKLAAYVGVAPNDPIDVANPLIKQKLVEGILLQEGRGPGGVDGTQYAQQQSAAYASLTNNAKQSQRLIDDLLKEDPRKPETMQRLAEAQAMQRQYMQQALKLQEKMPSADPREPMQKLGGLATIVGILGGLLTKTPMTASLNAGAAAMEAYKAQDDTAYKRNMEQWGYHTDMLLKMAKFEQDTYREILDDEKTTASEKANKLNTVAHLLGSQRMIDASILGDLRAAQNHQDAMQNHRETLAEQKRAHDLAYGTGQGAVGGKGDVAQQTRGILQVRARELGISYDELVQEHPEEVVTAREQAKRSLGPTTAASTEADLLKELDAARNSGDETQIKAAEQKVNDYNKIHSRSVGRNAQQTFLNKYMEEHPQAGSEDIANAMGDFRRVQALEGAFAGGIIGRQIISLNTVADHILRVQESWEALKNGDIPRFNAIANRVSRETGGPEVTNFEVGRDIMADEIVRLLTSTGGTESDRKGMQERLSRDFSPAQIEGAVKQLKDFTGARFDSLKQQYAQGDKIREDKFTNRLLTEKSRQVYGGSQTPAATPPSAPSPAAAPARPSAVPDGSAYSPSRKQWRDPTGKVYDEKGNAI